MQFNCTLVTTLLRNDINPPFLDEIKAEKIDYECKENREM